MLRTFGASLTGARALGIWMALGVILGSGGGAIIDLIAAPCLVGLIVGLVCAVFDPVVARYKEAPDGVAGEGEEYQQKDSVGFVAELENDTAHAYRGGQNPTMQRLEPRMP